MKSTKALSVGGKLTASHIRPAMFTAKMHKLVHTVYPPPQAAYTLTHPITKTEKKKIISTRCKGACTHKYQLRNTYTALLCSYRLDLHKTGSHLQKEEKKRIGWPQVNDPVEGGKLNFLAPKAGRPQHGTSAGSKSNLRDVLLVETRSKFGSFEVIKARSVFSHMWVS